MRRTPQVIIRLGSNTVARRGVSPSASAPCSSGARRGAVVGPETTAGCSLKGRPGAVDGYRQQKLISTVEVPAGVRWSSSTQVVPLEDIQNDVQPQSRVEFAGRNEERRTMQQLGAGSNNTSTSTTTTQGMPLNQGRPPVSNPERPPITHIGGRQVPATTREAMALNLEARRLQTAERTAQQQMPDLSNPAERATNAVRNPNNSERFGKFGRLSGGGYGLIQRPQPAEASDDGWATRSVMGSATPNWAGVDAHVAKQSPSPLAPSKSLFSRRLSLARAGSPASTAREKAPAVKETLDARIDFCAKNRQSLRIVGIWEEIENREKVGNRVKLLPQSYQHIMSAIVDSPDAKVVRKCSRVFDHLVSNGVKASQQVYNEHMKGCAITGMGFRAKTLMERLNEESEKTFRPTASFMYDLLLAVVKEGMVEDSKKYYSLCKSMAFFGTSKVLHAVQQLFVDANQLEDAVTVMEDTHQAGFKPRDPHANKLTYACIRAAKVDLVHKVLDLMDQTGNVIVAHTVQNVFFVAARKKDPDLATKMWILAQKWNHEFSDMDYNFTVVTFVTSGKDQMALATITQAYKVGRKMTRKTLDQVAEKLALSNNRLDGAYYTLASLHETGEPVPVEAVNTIIAGCAMRRSVDRCFSTVDALTEVFGLTPDLYTFNSMMYALAGMKKQKRQTHTPLGAGMAMLDKMDRAGVAPDEETYLRLIDLVCSTLSASEESIAAIQTRMKTDYSMEMNPLMKDMVAVAFHQQGLYENARYWAQQVPGREKYQGAADGHVLNMAAAERRGYFGDGHVFGSNGRQGGGDFGNNNGGGQRNDSGNNHRWQSHEGYRGGGRAESHGSYYGGQGAHSGRGGDQERWGEGRVDRGREGFRGRAEIGGIEH